MNSYTGDTLVYLLTLLGGSEWIGSWEVGEGTLLPRTDIGFGSVGVRQHLKFRQRFTPNSGRVSF